MCRRMRLTNRSRVLYSNLFAGFVVPEGYTTRAPSGVATARRDLCAMRTETEGIRHCIAASSRLYNVDVR